MQVIKYFWAIRSLINKPFFSKMGSLCYMGKPSFIEGRKRISIGNKVRIYPGIRLQALHSGNIIINDNVAIEQNVQIVSMSERLIIGNDVTIAANVFISNVNHKYDDVTRSVMDQGYEVRSTKIGDGCFIGYGAVILPGTVLGRHCIVGSNSVVSGTYSDFSVIVGAPGRVIKKYNNELKKWEGVKNR